MNRWLIRGLIAFAALLGGVALALFVVTRDEPLPDISDIAETRPPVADADNAFLGLLSVGAEVAARAEKNPELLAALTAPAFAAEDAADSARAATEATRDLQPAWRAALARPGSLAPAHRDADNPPYPFSDLHRLGRLATLWAETEAANSPRDALLLDLDAIRAARHITDSYDTLIVYLTGVACSQLAIRHLQTVAARQPLPPDLARELIAGIEACQPTDAAFSAALRNEIHFAVNYTRRIDLAKDFAAWEAMGFAPPPRGAELFFKPNQTARWSVDELRLALTQVDARPLSAVSLPVLDHGSPTLIWGLPHPDNAAGRYLAGLNIVTMESVFAIRLKHRSALSALQAWLAARAYQHDHGELPPDLDTLVPGYLPRVPVDFCAAAPIRYSREARAIWSVGASAYEISDATIEPVAGETDFRLPAD